MSRFQQLVIMAAHQNIGKDIHCKSPGQFSDSIEKSTAVGIVIKNIALLLTAG